MYTAKPRKLINYVNNTLQGTLNKANVMKVHTYVNHHYGDLVKFPGIMGQRDTLMSFDPKVSELVFRTEGIWPVRRALEIFNFYRRHLRPEVFGEETGLIFDQGKTWYKMRQIVNPVMMKSNAVSSYIPVIDEVTRDFVARIHGLRDENSEMPEDFQNEISLWALESIGSIALDRRIGAFEEPRSEDANMFIKVNFRFKYVLHNEP